MNSAGRTKRAAAAAAAVLMLSGGCTLRAKDDTGTGTGATGKGDGFDAQLISSLSAFDACDDLLSYLRTEGANVVGAYGFQDHSGPSAYTDGPVAAQRNVASDAAGAAEAANGAAPPAAAPDAGKDFSTTNVQEEGVDEPDLVKTDGRRLVTIAGGTLRLVDLTGPKPRLAGSLSLDGPDKPGGERTAIYWSGGEGQLLLAGDRVVVLRSGWSSGPGPRPGPIPVEDGPGNGIAADVAYPYRGGPPTTRVSVVDISGATPTLVDEATFDGDLVAARQTKGMARLVLRSTPPGLPFLYPSGGRESMKAAKEANEKIVAESTLEDWLPGYVLGDKSDDRRLLSECDQVQRPSKFSGLSSLSVVSFDPADGRPGPGATVFGTGETVYASADNLYVTSTVWTNPNVPAPEEAGKVDADKEAIAPPPAKGPGTDIHQFAIADPVRTNYVASGHVDGRLLNSFSMSEHEGVLRVATTDDAISESGVTVLRPKEKILQTIGHVGGLGKTEQIYAVRFLGDRGYVVTFRQTDPLYVLDLTKPEQPTVTGELKITGYSAYLHPLADHRLLGVGQDASEQGRIQGTQVSLFDVADPTDPRRLASAVVPNGRSEAEYDHHAFLFWAPTKLAAVPVMDGRTGRVDVIGYRIDGDTVKEVGRISSDGNQVRRTVVVGDSLLTIADDGLKVSDLTTLAERSRLSF